MITYTDYHRLMLSAADCADFDDFVSKCGGSLPVSCLGSNGEAAPAIALLRTLWQLHEDPGIRTIASIAGRSMSALSRRYGIPLRTLQGWGAPEDSDSYRDPTDYVLELIAVDVINTAAAEAAGEPGNL